MEHSENHYFVPAYSKLPFFGALGLFLLGYGSLNLLHADTVGIVIFLAGALILSGILFAWFREVIHEQSAGLYSEQIDRSFRWGMVWFIFTEVFLFGIFLSALFYARVISVPALAGIGANQDVMTHILLWPNFQDAWPLLKNPNPAAFPGSTGMIKVWHIPLVNTIILVISAIAARFSLSALKKNKRQAAIGYLLLTMVLGIFFLLLQIQELYYVNNQFGLTISSGIFGSTYFMVMGLHSAHIIVGLLMLAVMLFRLWKGHFSATQHFAVKASIWFWQFITVIWLVTFIFVYLV